MKATRRVYSSGGKSSGYHLGGAHKTLPSNPKPEDAIPHNGMKYEDLKAHVLEQGELYEDPDFPATDASLFFSREPPREFEWKRPKEIRDDPKFLVDGASRFDITQGMLGDCWLLAAVASLVSNQGLFDQVIPIKDIDFDSDEYCGLFVVRFWQYGRCVEVVVDDRLHTYNNQLVFMHSADYNEFWSALLEKAYAKVCGSYEALKGGQTSEAMEDFTGGVCEVFDLKKAPDDFHTILLKAEERQSLICCSINAQPNEIEFKLENGLIMGHAYTITSLKKVTGPDDEEVELIRVRNPWGNEREWNGAWSDESEEWQFLSDEDKEEIGLNYDDDGEFWMCFSDFKENFSRVDVCMLSPDAPGDHDERHKHWESVINLGSWQKHVSAGGCRNFPDSFWLNPQYRIKLEDPDDDGDVDNCTVVIALLQMGRRKQKRVGAQNLTIGFAVYRFEEDSMQYLEQDRFNKDFFLYHKSIARSDNFVNSREVIGRFCLPPGEYMVLPSTFQPQEEGDFIVRIFSEQPHEACHAMDTKTEIEYKLNKDEEENEEDEEQKEQDDNFKQFFDAVGGEDGEIDPFEVQEVLNQAFREHINDGEFSLEACRSIVAMTDRDRNGTLDYPEFRSMWRNIMQCLVVFKEYDRDESGDMNAFELRSALGKLGFKLSTPVLSSLALRYSNRKGSVCMDDFVQICCRIKSTFESYLGYQGKSFTLDDYIMSAVYC